MMMIMKVLDFAELVNEEGIMAAPAPKDIMKVHGAWLQSS